MRPMRSLLGTSIFMFACSPELHVGEADNEPRETTVLSDEPPAVIATRATDRVVSIVEESRPIVTFGIDNGELYWVTITAERESEVDWQLYRCSLDNCAATAQSVGTSTFTRATAASTTRTIDFDESAAYFYWGARSMPIRCDKNGWKGTTAQPVLDLPGDTILVQGTLYWWTDSSVVRKCVASDCAATWVNHERPNLLASDSWDWSEPWLEADSEHLYTWWNGSIWRYAIGLMQPFELFVAHDATVSDIAASGDQLYWTEMSSYAAVRSCPISGCEGEARILIDGLSNPVALRVDGSRIYVAEMEYFSGQLPWAGSLTRYSLEGAEQPMTLLHERDNVGQSQPYGPLLYVLSCAVRSMPQSNPYVFPRSCSISGVAR